MQAKGRYTSGGIEKAEIPYCVHIDICIYTYIYIHIHTKCYNPFHLYDYRHYRAGWVDKVNKANSSPI